MERFITLKHKIRSFTTYLNGLNIYGHFATLCNPSLQFCTEEITVAFLLFLPLLLTLRMGDFLINSTFNGELCEIK